MNKIAKILMLALVLTTSCVAKDWTREMDFHNAKIQFASFYQGQHYNPEFIQPPPDLHPGEMLCMVWDSSSESPKTVFLPCDYYDGNYNGLPRFTDIGINTPSEGNFKIEVTGVNEKEQVDPGTGQHMITITQLANGKGVASMCNNDKMYVLLFVSYGPAPDYQLTCSFACQAKDGFFK